MLTTGSEVKLQLLFPAAEIQAWKRKRVWGFAPADGESLTAQGSGAGALDTRRKAESVERRGRM